MTSRSLTGMLIGAAVLIAAVFFAVGQKGNRRDEVREEVTVAMERMPDYAANGPWYYELLFRHHDACFDKAYVVEQVGSGRRARTKTTFYRDAYLDDVFEAMIADARRQGREKQAEHLAALRPTITLK